MESIIPTTQQIKEFLDAYGWKYRENHDTDQEVILSDYALENEQKGILIGYRIEGEFVIVSTIKFLNDVPKEFAYKFFEMNDKIKLVKIYPVLDENEKIEIELGFELWAESWNKETFFAFMDMFCMAIEKVMEIVEKENIPHETKFVTYEGK